MRYTSALRSGIRQGNYSNHHVKGIARLEQSTWEVQAYKVSF